MRLPLLSLLLIAACATSALAQTSRGQGARPSERETLAEMQARLEQLFDRLDTDGDDSVTTAELQRTPGGRMLMQTDADGDGSLTLDEVREGAAALFKTMDANGDGVVTADERRSRR